MGLSMIQTMFNTVPRHKKQKYAVIGVAGVTGTDSSVAVATAAQVNIDDDTDVIYFGIGDPIKCKLYDGVPSILKSFNKYSHNESESVTMGGAKDLCPTSSRSAPKGHPRNAQASTRLSAQSECAKTLGTTLSRSLSHEVTDTETMQTHV